MRACPEVPHKLGLLHFSRIHLWRMNGSLTLTEGLTLATLVLAIISMTMSIMVLWPQCRHGMAAVRDVVLWMALVFVVVGALTVGWRRVRNEDDDRRPPFHDVVSNTYR